ncbi:putative phage abortive infection protein [Weeksellaceae bacterium TAE3-ERU29]|nr:putative phage abortive infection protein [Weeksellaceae bacterium TAE3-ERU29]
MSKRNKVFMCIGVFLSIILFIYSSTYIWNYYSSNDILWYIPTKVETEKDIYPSQAGNSIGDILSPIIGLLASVLTFLAFYIQKIANDEIKAQFKVQQFENQFYEMVRLHKENVNEIEIKTKSGITLKGRSVFFEMKEELEVLLRLNEINENEINEKVFKEVYVKFFWGVKKTKKYIQESLKSKDTRTKKTINKEMSDLKISPLKGYHSFLGHYYRHLFHIVKFISNSSIEESEKMKYLRVLRAQLSNYEQIMLFYNWLSEYGEDWENDSNNFFTRYKMIHNLWYDNLPEYNFFREKLNELQDRYRKNHPENKDNLFEIDDI